MRARTTGTALCLLIGTMACGTKPAAPEFPAQPLLSVMSASGQLHFDVYCQVQPVQPGVRVFQFTITSPAGVPQTGLQFSVLPWMPAYGHSAPIAPVVQEMGKGVYQVQEVDLFADGGWQFVVTITAPTTDTATMNFDAEWPSS